MVCVSRPRLGRGGLTLFCINFLRYRTGSFPIRKKSSRNGSGSHVLGKASKYTDHLLKYLVLAVWLIRPVLNEPIFSKKFPKFQVFGTCTQAFLQMFSEYLERSRARKFSTGSFQFLEPISTFPKYLCEGRHG